MALHQVGARTEGDVFQGLFFWKQAADLLRPGRLVERVELEHDEADGVDDVAVFYRAPGANAGRHLVSADYFQLKYHVDNRDAYSADALIDPKFINAKRSLLKRFHETYVSLQQGSRVPFRLHLASNWRWKDGDKLAGLLREYDGELPQRFFDDGAKSDLGKIREMWRSHLGLDGVGFERFARTLRFQLDHFGRREFKAHVYATLDAAGLRTPSADRASCPYESLAAHFLMIGVNSFDESSFRALCEREGLISDARRNTARPYSIGVRSFMRFAERLESEVDDFVCVASHFNGRHSDNDGSWRQSADKLLAFLGDPERRRRLRSEQAVIALECHGSFALMAGWELSRNSGADVAPLQKPNLDVWRPSDPTSSGASWGPAQTIERDVDSADVAICLSVTHDTRADVERYLDSDRSAKVRRLVLLSPEGGPSPQSIKGPDHAYQLAAALPALIAAARPNRFARVHLFFACPNALMFFIGQQREALGRLALYEFDFGFERDASYHLSFTLPLAASAASKKAEDKNDS